jgi:acyl-CoA thioesterase
VAYRPQVVEAFFEERDGALVPHDQARGPWAADMMHGRLLAGLAGWAIERDHGDPSLQLTRLTVDLFKNPPMKPVEVSTSLVRDGRRVRAADASVVIDGIEVARASALMLRRDEHPAAQVWGEPRWSVPKPEEIAPRDTRPGSWDMRPITASGFGGYEQKRLWLRDRWPLVQGQPMTPFARAAAVADFANPFANSGAEGLQFINADLTLYLRRDPTGEWLGLEVAAHLGEAGIAIGECTIFDETGAVGRSTVSSVANAMTRRPRP